MDAVICYPYIQPNRKWLNIAALCWEHVYRITSVHAPPDSSELESLNATLGGFLKSIYPEEVVSPELELTLEKWLDSRRDRRGRATVEPREDSSDTGEGFLLFPDKIPSYSLQNVLREHGVIRQQTITAPWWMEEYYRNLTSEPVFMNVHRWKPSGGSAAAAKARYERYLAESEGKYEEGDKSGARLLKRKAEELRKRSLREFGLGPYVLVDRDVAVHYLSLIARRRAEELNADLFAEDFTAAESAIEAIPAVVGHVGTSLMRAYLPKDIGNLPANKIAEFRARTETDRIKFQKAIQSLVNDYSSVSSAEGLERLKRMAVELAREKVEGTRKAYSSIRIETTLKALGTSLAPPALVSWLSSVLHLGLFAPAAIAATLALFGAQMLSDREKMRSDADKDSWSYVLKAARGLKSN